MSRLSFQPVKAFQISTDTSPEDVCLQLDAIFNKTSEKTFLYNFYYDRSSFMGDGKSFRIDRNIKQPTAYIDLVASGDMTRNEKQTNIFVQYNGYLHWVTRIVCWAWTIFGLLLIPIALFVLFMKHDWSVALVLFGIAIVLIAVPQFIKFYYSLFANDLHRQVIRVIDKKKS